MSTENNITSGQIIQQSYLAQVRLDTPKQTVDDLEELRSLQLTKRKEFEQQLNKNRLNFGQWLRYAKWEAEFSRDLKRARSVYERALEVNVEHVPFWVNYIKFELTNSNINHARNLFDRAIALLPRIDKFWFMYVQTEETLQNYAKVRQLFKSWMKWQPPANVWDAYINFERRYDEFDNVREIFKEYIIKYPNGITWSHWIDFELDRGDEHYIRGVFEYSIDELLKSDLNDGEIPSIIEKWATWEFKSNESERAMAIFKFVLDKSKFAFSAAQYQSLLNAFTNFERKYGNEASTGENVPLKQKLKYIASVEQDPYDVDSWWLLLDSVYGDEFLKYMELATSPQNIPKDSSKSILWKRYIYLWIKYAFYAEFTVKDIGKARSIWNDCLSIIPKSFMFGKVWTLFADFEIRNNPDGVPAARKVLGRSIGTMTKPKDNIFEYYVLLERKLGEWDRVRKIYEKWFEMSLIHNVRALKVLLKYIEFEQSLQEYDRCESLFKIGLEFIKDDLVAIRLKPLDYLYMSFIDYYKEQFEYEKARDLFELMIQQTGHVKIWIAYAQFESSIPNENQLSQFNSFEQEEFQFEIEEPQRESSRAVFKKAVDYYKQKKLDEERLIILEAWKTYEEVNGDEESVEKVDKSLPEIIKRTKTENNISKEYIEYVFPDDKPTIPNFSKFLQNAKNWAAVSKS